MPRKIPKGSESRLSREGLRGATIDGKEVVTIVAHGELRRERTVRYRDGTRENRSIYELVGRLIEQRNK